MSAMNSVAGVKDVSPEDAWSAVKSDPAAVLVDVRTTAEWTYVGIPKLADAGKKPILIEWQTFPTMAVNSDFVSTLDETLRLAGAPPEAALYFLCRSGVRSKAAAAAMIEAGWSNSFNIAGGFEGAPDPSGHRGLLSGWKASGLPWAQG